MRVRLVLVRSITFAAAAAACAWLTSVVGPWAAVGLWAAATGLACSLTAVAMHRQPPERVTAINVLAGYLLPFGYQIGRGRLMPIVLTSWVIWVLVGIAAALAASGHRTHAADAPEGPSTVVSALLFLSWLVDGGVVLRLIGILAMRRRRPQPSILFLVICLTALVAASIALTLLGRTAPYRALALALAGGPPLFVGGGYGLYVLFILVFCRKARWN